MSEPAAERATRPGQSPPAAGGGFFQRKIGPLPAWGWLGLAGVAALGWWYFKNRGAGAGQSAAATTAADPTATGDDVQGELSTIQTEIQGLQGSESTEGSSTGTTNSGTGSSSGGNSPAIRHVSTGKETLNQIAKARGTSVAHIVSVSSAGPESAANLSKLEAWAAHPGTKRKGIVYYTSNGPVQGATA